MLDKTFAALYSSTSTLTIGNFLICVGVALALGALVALTLRFRERHSAGFLVTLALLPAAVAVVIMLVNGNLGAGVAVAGAFSLVRFRSTPGTAKEIAAIFVAMAIGLGCGMGYPGFAALFTAIMCVMLLLCALLLSGQANRRTLQKVLRITVPEDLDYSELFDDLFATYTRQHQLISVKTTNLGSLNRLTYEIELKKAGTEKAFIDELRVRNGNLEISMSILADKENEL